MSRALSFAMLCLCAGVALFTPAVAHGAPSLTTWLFAALNSMELATVPWSIFKVMDQPPKNLGDEIPIVGFFANAVTGTVSELMATREALRTLTDIWRGREKFRKGSAHLRALDLLPHYPVVTTQRLERLLTVSQPAALRATNRLLELGILQERTGYKRNRIFASREALDIINRPFGETPVLPGETRP